MLEPFTRWTGHYLGHLDPSPAVFETFVAGSVEVQIHGRKHGLDHVDLYGSHPTTMNRSIHVKGSVPDRIITPSFCNKMSSEEIFDLRSFFFFGFFS